MKSRSVFLICLIMMSFSTHSQDADGLMLFREQFSQIKTIDDARALLELDESQLSEEEIVVARAYKGTVKCMMAGMVASPFKKLKYFNQGKSMIESSIAGEQVVENTYLRLLTQLKAPAMLKYNEMIDADINYFKRMLIEAPIDDEWKSFMLSSLMEASNNDQMEERLKGIQMNF